jgi:hypothetical protein
MVGIDISGFQPDNVEGSWDFIVVKSTQGTEGVVNPKVGAQWANAARTTRGLYHYARPAESSGAMQADLFADDALARGFRPNIDMWQLDAEDGLNAGVSNAQWQTFVSSFMDRALARLGSRGFVYMGWYFVLGHGLQPHINKYKWWLPAYGPDDGGVHDYPPGVPANLVVIQQYTDQGGVDKNVIKDLGRYLPTPTPPPPPAPPKVRPTYMPALQLPPIVSACACPTGGAWLLGADGGVFGFGGAPFKGCPHGDKNVKLRDGEGWSQIRPANAKEHGYTYVCITTDGDPYAY